MAKHDAFHRIIEQETARIIGTVPDNEVRHDWPTLWRGIAGLATLDLTTIEPPVWQLYSYVPIPDEQGLHPITSYQYAYDGHLISVARTEATRTEMADGTSANRLRDMRETDMATPIPPDYLRLATLLQQAPPIQITPSQIIVG